MAGTLSEYNPCGGSFDDDLLENLPDLNPSPTLVIPILATNVTYTFHTELIFVPIESPERELPIGTKISPV